MQHWFARPECVARWVRPTLRPPVDQRRNVNTGTRRVAQSVGLGLVLG